MPTILDATVVNQPYDTSGNGGRKLVRLENGWLVAGAKTGSGTSQIVYLYKSTDNGQTWSQLCYIQHGTGSSQIDFSFATKGNTLYILSPNLDSNVFFYKVDVENQTNENIYPNRITIDSGQNTMGNGSLAINEDGTELHAAWASRNPSYPNSFNIRYAKGTINADGSVTWGAVEQVTTRNTSGIPFYLEPSIVVNNNGVPVIICSFDGGSNFNKCIKAIEKSSGNWSERNVYDSVSIYYAQSSPSACVDKNGRIWVAWHGGDSGESTAHLRVSYSDDGGVTWSAMEKITSGTPSGRFASITANKDNKVFIIFNRGNASVSEIWLAENNAGTWSTTKVKDTTDSNTNAIYASTLLDINLGFSFPLFVYSQINLAKVGFYGTWVINTISVTPGYIGQKTSADKSNILTYSITTDGTMSDITERINGVTIATRTNPTSGQEFTVSLSQAQWDAIKYGNGHTLTIEMGSDVWTYTFDKRLNANDDILSAVKGVQDLQDHLNAVKAQLASVIRAKGGTVNDTDTWQTFINVVAGLSYAGAKRFASGTVTSSSSSNTFQYAGSTSVSSFPFVTVTGLTFKPSLVVLFGGSSSDSMSIYSENTDPRYPKTVKLFNYGSQTATNTTTYNFKGDVSPASVTSTGFTLPAWLQNATYTWFAFE